MATVVGQRTLRDLLEHRARTTPRCTFVMFDDLAGNVVDLGYAHTNVVPLAIRRETPHSRTSKKSSSTR